MKKLKFSHRLIYGYIQLLYKIFNRPFVDKYFAKTRRYHFKIMYAHLQTLGVGKITPIKRVKNISIKELKKKYISKGIPVVIEGGAKDWKCVKNWSLEYFKKLHGDDNVTIVGFDNNLSEKAYEITTLKEIINNIQNKGSKYFRFYPLLEEHPEHIKDFDYKFLKSCKNSWNPWEQFQVFIGGKETHTQFHNSMASNIFVQAFGQKKWIMYHSYYTSVIDPDAGKNFHRGAPYKTKEGSFTAFKPNYEKPYSAFKYIDGISVDLSPGDILFNPPHFWHEVVNTEDSIGIGYRWLSTRAGLRVSPWYTLLDLITIPFSREAQKFFKQDFKTTFLKEIGEYDDYVKEVENV